MFFTKNRNLIRWAMILISFVIISLILWNTYVFFQNFKAEERIKMENWAAALKEVKETERLNSNMSNLPLIIITSNHTTPMISVAKDGSLSHSNIDEEKAEDEVYLQQLITRFEIENEPIEIKYDDELIQTLYYGDAPLLNKLKYYPLALILIILLFSAVVYLFYKSNQNATQNKLWSGMAKETAHQIGTPLSSLVGWAEILKTENVNPEYIVEIEKDISRLQTITERFSKIGSLPTLIPTDIVAATNDAYQYLKARSSKLIAFEISLPDHPIQVNLNASLYSWTIENLVKNGIDAMKGKGTLSLALHEKEDNVYITISDTGKGIAKQHFQSIFEPGYTTKKRGWGLGLSLVKRIVEEFHHGKIKVLKSEIGKGTTMQITLKSLL